MADDPMGGARAGEMGSLPRPDSRVAARLYAGLTMQEIDDLIDVHTVQHNPENAVQLIRALNAEVRRLSEGHHQDSL